MNKYIIWIGIPLIAVILSIFFSDIISVMPEPSSGSLIDYKPLKDPKLKRTVKSFAKEMEDLGPGKEIDLSITPGHLINIEMAPKNIDQIHNMVMESPGIEDVFDIRIRFGDQPGQRASLRLRGGSSLNMEKKSFHINLFHKIGISQDIRVKKIYLISMSHDSGMFRMRFSYLLLHELGLFPSFNEYVRVYINGKPQGIYLMVERPVDAIRRTRPGIVSITRGGVFHDIKYQGREPGALELVKRLASAHTIRDEASRLKEYEDILDIDSYLRWLAFNSLVRNGDSWGEYYSYESRLEKHRYGIVSIVAWDYDDIMAPPARPEKSFEDPLFYACEEKIDFFIRDNKKLYDRYREILRAMLKEQMTMEHLLETLDHVTLTLGSIDTGFSPEREEVEQNHRLGEIERFKKGLTERHGELMEILGAKGKNQIKKTEHRTSKYFLAIAS